MADFVEPVQDIETVQGIATIADFIIIGKNTLFYKTVESKYIITYIDEYDDVINYYMERIFHVIFPLYDSNKLAYSNVCGANAEYICENVKIPEIKFGKIIITDWIKENKENIQAIKDLYGPIGITIGASYHALAYLEIDIGTKKHYISIETTNCHRYKLQFYIDADETNFKTIINTRYQCKRFKRTFDCKTEWWDEDIAFFGGKKSKKRKSYNKKRHRRTKTQRRRRRSL